MKAKEGATWFVPRPDDQDVDQSPTLVFRLESWDGKPTYFLDGDKLLLTITALKKNGKEIENGTGLLSQYGGSELLLQMASSNQLLEEGTEWILSYKSHAGFVIQPR